MTELPDRVSEIFRDKTIFITGATGFIGKVLVEKLLRVTEVKKMYFLIRRKKGKSPKERLQEMFNNILFKLLNELRPDAIKKCVPIYGDVSEIDLGIAPEDREILKNEVDFIFHSAATTKFDDPLKYAVLMNTRGTKFALDLAEECKHLKNVIPKLLENIRGMDFQHDGVRPHFEDNVRDHLDDQYPNRSIGCGGPLEWPSRLLIAILAVTFYGAI